MMESRIVTRGILTLALCVLATTSVLAQNGWVKWHQQIDHNNGGFSGNLSNNDQFGCSMAWLGDLDGDGVGDVAVGAMGDDDGFSGGEFPEFWESGAVWVLFLNTDGTVKTHQKISKTQGGFSGGLGEGDRFGSSVVSLGDMDGDGVIDIAVGAVGDDDGVPFNAGAVWILFLNADGTVKSHQKISKTQGGFTGSLGSSQYFGSSVASPGDLDGDGVQDLVVGARGDGKGALWVLFLRPNGWVKSHQKISNDEGGMNGSLGAGARFGSSVASLGDFDGDGVTDLVVGADGEGGGRGSVRVLLMNSNGTVKSYLRITSNLGGFTGHLDNRDNFGYSVASMGDLDGDGVQDLAVGAIGDDDGDFNRGAVWVLFLNSDGTVKSHQKISSTEGGFTGSVPVLGEFGSSVASLGDLDGDGLIDLAVGQKVYHDQFQRSPGAVWMLFLDGVRGDVVPDSYSFFRGLQTGGALADLFNSDDSWMTVQPGITLSNEERQVQLIVTGTAPTETPSELKFRVEAHADINNIGQWIHLWNYDTNAYEFVDYMIATTTDSVVEISITTDPGRFIQAGTKQMKARVSYKEAGIIFLFPWLISFDRTVWIIDP